MSRILSVWVDNKPGVLARIAGLIARRGFNISSLEVHETDDPNVSAMKITVYGDDYIHHQIIRQLGKLHDVLSID